MTPISGIRKFSCFNGLSGLSGLVQNNVNTVSLIDVPILSFRVKMDMASLLAAQQLLASAGTNLVIRKLINHASFCLF